MSADGAGERMRRLRGRRRPGARGSWSRRSRRLAMAAMGAAMLTVVAACSTGSDAVDQGAGGQYRYVGATGRGSVIPVAKRRLSGDVRQTLIGGGQFQLSTLRGKVVVLNFWASWCVPCKTESPMLERVYERQKAHGVQFVGIDIKDERQAAQAFVQDLGISYLIVYDEPGRSALQIGNIPTRGLPTTVVIDKHGKVAAIYAGALTQPDIEPVVVRLAGEA